MTQLDTTTDPTAAAGEIVSTWLAEFNQAAENSDVEAILDLLVADPWWRDLFALTWDLTGIHGVDDVRETIGRALKETGLGEIALDASVPPHLEGDAYLEAVFTFGTRHGRGRGVVRLVLEEGRWRAALVSTSLQSLRGFEPRRVSIDDAADDANNLPVEPGTRFTLEQLREQRIDYNDADPSVLIVGAGHSGMFLSAHLKRLGVSALMVDAAARAGDNWRLRYHGLILHDTKWAIQFPYMPFPDTWPLFTPKDMLADWMEAYVKLLDLDLWLSTTIVSATYDAVEKRWTVELERGGERRTLRPSHLVFATGKDGVPVTPDIPGMAQFEGTVAHSVDHVGGAAVAGKRVVIVGTGASAHDIAQDAYEHGATSVTMLQRSPVMVFSQRHGIKTLHGRYYGENSPPVEDADLLASANPLALSTRMSHVVTRKIAADDAEMLAGLAKAGYRAWLGPDDAGQAYLASVGGGSIYIDKGAAQLIIDGKIRIQPGQIASFTPTGVVYGDGTSEEADVVVLSTGFTNMRDVIRPIVGDDVADQIGEFWGVDERGEIRTAIRHSGHEKLWLVSNGLRLARIHTKHLSLVIKAIEEGILDPAISVEKKTS